MLQVVPSHRSASVPALEPPTAVQATDDVHAMPARTAPAGLGADWIRHLLPFHRSTSVLRDVPGGDPPTAVHADGEVHDTPFSRPPPAGLGMGWSCHLVPSHRSASTRHARDRLTVTPTASQADGDTQDTLVKMLHAAPDGPGTGWMRQLFPFHRSARGTPVPEALT